MAKAGRRPERIRNGIGDSAAHADMLRRSDVASIRASVLIFHGDHDSNVSIEHGRMMARRLESAGKRVELVAFPGLDHGIEDSAARADMLRRSDAFLREALGMTAPPAARQAPRRSPDNR